MGLKIIFVLSREDVVDCAREMGIPEEAITDDVLEQVKKGVEWGLECLGGCSEGSHKHRAQKLG